MNTAIAFLIVLSVGKMVEKRSVVPEVSVITEVGYTNIGFPRSVIQFQLNYTKVKSVETGFSHKVRGVIGAPGDTIIVKVKPNNLNLGNM